jgi:chromosome segregation ATPase
MSEELARIGDIIDAEVDPRDDQIDQLERQVAKLRGELSDARHELTRVREDSNRALTHLRQTLSPLYRSLQRVFGELDDAGVSDVAGASAAAQGVSPAPASGTDARVTAVWASWKEKFSPACGKVIDALLLHGELNSVQIKVAARIGSGTVSESIGRLNKAGLITKNGNRFSLKVL